MPLILVILFLFANNSYAESVPSPQAIGLLEYCSPIESDHSSYQEKLGAARIILNNYPKEFYECYLDADCVLTSGACGETVSVAFMAQSCFDRASSLYGAVIDCESIKENWSYTPECTKNRCTLKTSKSAPVQ